MGTDSIRRELGVTVEKLSLSAGIIRDFLNNVTLPMLIEETGEDSVKEEDLSLLLDQLRRLLVYSDEAVEACKTLLRRNTLQQDHASKRMVWVYHYCVEEFFQPRLDTWYEDSRAAYCGKHAVVFRFPVPDRVTAMMMSCEDCIQKLREELEAYTDYRAGGR
ncbi:DUF3907 family protein [Alteribacter natronophilus]|uniref:DUF3907 family protein n=1 Tax=Alteribacter natronophilus TaxID=2583810 RepID=UPI00110D6E4C|nr:DUF3907 family protein [Alteribacter natronophilus]TMW73659.1 DUF3907 family protein [Alteribacter natronophilus]